MGIKKNVEARDLLPLGSVVTLKVMNKKIIIIRQYMYDINEEDNSYSKGTIYDYSGVLWPEGDINSDARLAFDHDLIDTVFFNGYTNEESLNYLEGLYEIIRKY